MKLLDLAPDEDDLLRFMSDIGWSADRKADIRDDLEEWAAKNYDASTEVVDFMVACSGLSFEYPRHPAVGGSHSCVVSGALSARRIPRTLVAEYERRLDRLLCPIGQSGSGNLFLMMDSAGVTYGGRDRYLARIADDGYHALLAVSTGTPMTPIS